MKHLGFVSDAHGHTAALAKGITILREFGVEEIHFLGDALGYLPSHGALELLLAEGIPCIQGSHDVSALAQATQADKDMQAIRDWPLERVLSEGPWRLHLVHGSPRDLLHEHVYPDSDLTPLLPFSQAPCVVMGHSHRPFVRKIETFTFVNVGSCGIPRDDARFGAAALFDAETGQWRILRFNIEAETEELLRGSDISAEMRDHFARRRSKELVGEIVG